MLKTLARSICPPALWNAAKFAKRKHGFFGRFDNFDEAAQGCSGYGVPGAVEYAMRETHAIREDAPLDMRTLRLLAALQYVNRVRPELRVLDFGGSLGGHYFLTRRFLNIESWTVCELPSMASAGRSNFQNGPLTFIEDYSHCRPDVVIASGVLQYLRDPYAELAKLRRLGAQFMLVDRLHLKQSEYVSIQRVPTELFRASFPAWFLSRQRFMREISGMAVVMSWEADAASGFLLRAH